MNPLTHLYRRSRMFRLLCYFLMLIAYLIVYLVSDNSWARYSEFSTGTLLFFYGVFAAGAWWYSEDRDNRQRASENAAHDNGVASP